MLISLAVIVLIAVWIASLYFEQRANLRREVERLLQSTEVYFEDAGVAFKGADAKVLLRDYLSTGNGDSDPGLSAKVLCKMPDARIYSVLIETAHGEYQASVNVSLLGSEEIDSLLEMYPYLRRLREELRHGA